MARDIATAEAAKDIENAQRGINIAFISEVTQIFAARFQVLGAPNVTDVGNLKPAGDELPADSVRLRRGGLLADPARVARMGGAGRRFMAGHADVLPRVVRALAPCWLDAAAATGASMR